MEILLKELIDPYLLLYYTNRQGTYLFKTGNMGTGPMFLLKFCLKLNTKEIIFFRTKNGDLYILWYRWRLYYWSCNVVRLYKLRKKQRDAVEKIDDQHIKKVCYKISGRNTNKNPKLDRPLKLVLFKKRVDKLIIYPFLYFIRWLLTNCIFLLNL